MDARPFPLDPGVGHVDEDVVIAQGSTLDNTGLQLCSGMRGGQCEGAGQVHSLRSTIQVHFVQGFNEADLFHADAD